MHMARTKKTEAKTLTKSDAVMNASLARTIIRPWITEKAAYAAEKNVYTFAVALKATKPEITKAIKALYGVTPLKVNTTIKPSTAVFVRGNWGSKKAIKKAIVTLEKGQTIEFM
jgi:large subunit ribosomal protein L23